MLTDTHCHLNLNSFQEDLESVLERAWAQGVGRILIPGIDLPTSRQAVDLASHSERIFAAVGVHPSEAAAWTSDTRSELRELCRNPKVLAVGEIGLDYYRDHAPRPIQQRVFVEQLTLAAEVNLPVVVHNRESFDDLWAILSAWQKELVTTQTPLSRRPGVLHAFDGDLPTARQVTSRGFMIGVGGPVTYKNAIARHELAAHLDLESILIETDAPYLTPVPHRGHRNEPSYTAFIVNKIAELKNLENKIIAETTAANADRLFAWGAPN